jgi:hypothetical protein
MSFAWETTEEDILTCLDQMGRKNITPEEVSEIHNNLDHNLVTMNALWHNEFDDQVEGAYKEIKRQIGKMVI